ncbi:DNA gyrase inhibitor YacG [Alterinioella nitratireducens]|uniref:DNA gyrase inhibitor YacG n=1 Tax=Alterinioella nitratireducens TaxID=2735915 RepID=UPI004057DD64|tara:strand:- start:229 stop:420 length:192 start_codon:yes stop_codon:yes gene_type:complete
MTCPICKKPTDPEYRPFCSRRCADVDLGRWMTGSYAVPSDDPDDIEEATEAAGAATTDTSRLH